LAVDATGNVIRGTVTAGDAFLANTQTFTGINTFSNDMILSKSFVLTLQASDNFRVQNSSGVRQLQVNNVGGVFATVLTVLDASFTVRNGSDDIFNVYPSTVIVGIDTNAVVNPPLSLYPLCVGRGNITDRSGRILIKGKSITEGFGGSIDFQTWDSHTTAGARIECIDNNNWGAILTFHLKPDGAGAGGARVKVLSMEPNRTVFNLTSGFYSFRFNDTARFAITDIFVQSLRPHLFQQGAWMPVDGSTSFYITDTQPNTATSTYGRYFGTGGKIYQDFYNEFEWRRSPNTDGSAVTTLMALNSNGLTLNNAVGIGQPQLVFGGSGVPTIRMNGGGMNWYMNNTTNMGYFDAGGYGNGGAINGLGWRINGTDGLTLKSRGVYLESDLAGVNPTINAIVRHVGTGLYKWADNGWFSYGGAFVVSYDPVGNVTTGIGMGVSFDNNWCYFDMVKPGNYWAQGIFETGNANWYVNRSLAAYITGGGWTNVSDERCKHDIHDLSTSKSLQRILKCKPKYYKRIMEEPTGENPIPNKQEDIDRVHIGLLAQEVQDFNPHCVSTWHDKDEAKENEKLGIQYNDFVIHLIGAVQEQQKQIDTIKKLEDALAESGLRIDAQQQTIETLTGHLAKLTEQVNLLTKILSPV
jgi:hypothetical protein